MKYKLISIITVLLLALPPAVKGFDITAVVDKTQITKEDTLLLRLESTDTSAEPDTSIIEDFKVIPRGTSSYTNIANGKIDRKKIYQYLLIPLKTGELLIPPIKAVSGGQAAFTRAVVIQVSEQTVDPGKAKDLFATAQVSKSELVAGEQAVFTLKFFTSKQLSGLRFESPPDFKNLSSKPFDKEKTYTRTLNGVLYQVTQVDYVIMPLNPGTIVIEPAVLLAQVLVKTRTGSRFDSFFNDPFFSSRTAKPVSVRSNPVTITARPLPPYHDSDEFSGLIGSFSIQGEADKTQLVAGESLTFTLKISGTGNIKDAGLPKMDLANENFKVYDDTPQENISLGKAGYQGFKEFKKAIVPVKPGTFEIEPVAMVYYDVAQNAYQKIVTQAVLIDVKPSREMFAASAPLQPESGSSRVEKQKVTMLNQDILDIKEGLHVLEHHPPLSWLFFLLYLVAPAGLFLCLKTGVKIKKQAVPVEKEMKEKAASYLKQASKMQITDNRFLGHLYSALTSQILAKAEKRSQSLTPDEIKVILKDAKIDDSCINEAIQIFETIEAVRFGGRKMDEIRAKQLFGQVKRTMKLLCVILIFPVLMAVSPIKATAEPAADFVDGVKLYRQGEYKQAALIFEKVAEAGIQNPYLYYNIGNACLKAEDLGNAILWYERAKRLAPNDPDLKYNLAYAAAQVKDKKEETVSPLDILLFWDTVIPLKTLQTAAVTAGVLFFVWAAFRILKHRHIFSGMGSFLFVAFFLTALVAAASTYKQDVQQHAVIVAPQAPVRSGLSETATRLFTLHAGTRVRVYEKKDGYLKIFFEKGKVGWISGSKAGVI